MRFGRWLSPALLLCLITGEVCAAGCSPRNAPAQGHVTLRVGAALPASGPPTRGIRALVSLLTGDFLLSAGMDGREAPRIGESWSWNAERTVLTVAIKDKVYFHNGTLLTPDIAAEMLRREFSGEPVVTQVIAKPPHSIEIRLSQPDAFVLPSLFLTSVIDPASGAGAGPYIQVGEGNPVRLRAFDQYHVARPTIGDVEIWSYPTQRNAWAALMRGEIDVLHQVSRDAAEFVRAESAIRTYSFSRPYYIALVFNVRRPALARADVRQALNFAIDKDVVVREGMRSQGRPAESPVWPEHWANARTFRTFTHDPDRARVLLDGAGLHSPAASAGTMPARLSFTCLVPADDARFERLALVLQKQMFDVGVDMRLEGLPLGALEGRLAAGDFDAFIHELAGIRSLAMVYNFWHSPPPEARVAFRSGYSAADGALERVKHSASDEETRRAVAELLQVLRDDPPAAFIAWQDQARAVSARFEIPGDTTQRDIVGSIWQWQLRPPAPQASR